MAKRLIGSGTTDENGEVTITYTGTGAGELNIVAESGAFTSNTITIDDYTPAITNATITSNKDIIQSGENASLVITCKDQHNEIMANTDFDLCEQFVISNVDISSENNIVESGDTLNINAKVKTSEGGVPNNVPVVFKKGTTTLNTIQTNINGIATLPYSGSGSGSISIKAECDGIQSEPYALWDTLFFDDGVTSPKTANWNNYQSRLTVTVDETGTTLFRDASSGTGYYLTPSAYATPFVMEFEMVSITNKTSCGIDFAVNGSDNNKTFNALGINSGDSIKLTYDGTTIKVYINGSSTPNEIALSVSGNIDIGFVVGVNESIKFKDLKIYSG